MGKTDNITFVPAFIICVVVWEKLPQVNFSTTLYSMPDSVPLPTLYLKDFILHTDIYADILALEIYNTDYTVWCLDAMSALSLKCELEQENYKI